MKQPVKAGKTGKTAGAYTCGLFCFWGRTMNIESGVSNSFPPRDDDGVAHIVALSGGKDSTAMALKLVEDAPRPYTFVCTPTGDELPEMIEHWQKLSRLLGSLIYPVVARAGLQQRIREQACLPNSLMRWCTRELKLVPYYRWLETVSPCVSYVGLRADEESRDGFVFQDRNSIQMRFPMREWGWGLPEVLFYLERKKIKIPRRTDCARCYHQTLGEWWLLWHFHPEIYTDAEADEAFVSERRGKQYTFRNKTRDTWPASLAELRKRFEDGDVPRSRKGRMSMCRVCSL